MRRNWGTFREHYYNLLGDVYPQPEDSGHTLWAQAAINQMGLAHLEGVVLDVGCGQGFCQPFFEEIGLTYQGVTLGEDYQKARAAGRNVREADMSFLPWPGGSFGLIFARHVLEHSPFPVITLMEWRRVIRPKGLLALIAPTPEFWTHRGANHYSVLAEDHLTWMLDRSGWRVLETYKTFNTHHPHFLETSALDSFQKEALLEEGPRVIEFRILCEAGKAVKS